MHEGGLYRARARRRRAGAAEPTATRSRTPSTTSSCAPTSAATSASSARGVIEIAVVRGRQGIARMPGLGTQITDNAHALAMGKVVLARLRPEARRALRRHAGSTRYTPSTITDARRARRGAAAGARRRLRGRARGVRPRLLLRRRAGARRARPARRRARAVGVDAARSTPSTTSWPPRCATSPPRRARREELARREPPSRSNIVRKSTCFLSVPGPVIAGPHHCSRPRAPGVEGRPCTSTRRRSRQ